MSDETSGTDTSSTAARLKSFFERIERLDDEIADLKGDVKEVYDQAKSEGFNPKVMRKLVSLRKMNPSKRQTLEAELETYKTALGME